MRTTFAVQGMHCEACENRIKTALQQFPAITAMEVDHRRDLVAIEHQQADLEAAAMAIARLGFIVAHTEGV
jgi:copper chaperone CopZ